MFDHITIESRFKKALLDLTSLPKVDSCVYECQYELVELFEIRSVSAPETKNHRQSLRNPSFSCLTLRLFSLRLFCCAIRPYLSEE